MKSTLITSPYKFYFLLLGICWIANTAFALVNLTVMMLLDVLLVYLLFRALQSFSNENLWSLALLGGPALVSLLSVGTISLACGLGIGAKICIRSPWIIAAFPFYLGFAFWLSVVVVRWICRPRPKRNPWY